MIAETVRIATVVQTDLVLAVLPVVPRVANTSRHGEFYRTVAPMRTVVVAVSYGTVVIDEGRRALARPEAVADAVRFAERAVLPVRREGAWYARNVHLVFIMISMIIPGLAAMLTHLFIRILINIAKITGTADVRTVRPVITAVALAETVTTITLVVAVVRAVVHTQPPHVVEHDGWEGVVRRLLLLDAIADPAEHVDLAQGSCIRRPSAQMRHQNSRMVRPLIRPQVLQTSI